MLIIEIYVNSELIARETAVRVEGGMKASHINTYQLSDGTKIKHRYGDRAARLAKKMCNHLAKKYGA
jgi:hypothetical protein